MLNGGAGGLISSQLEDPIIDYEFWVDPTETSGYS